MSIEFSQHSLKLPNQEDFLNKDLINLPTLHTRAGDVVWPKKKRVSALLPHYEYPSTPSPKENTPWTFPPSCLRLISRYPRWAQMADFKCHSGPIEYCYYLHSLKSRKTLTFCFIELKCHGNADVVFRDWNTFTKKNSCHLLDTKNNYLIGCFLTKSRLVFSS